MIKCIMSKGIHIFFAFSEGLKQDIYVSKKTIEYVMHKVGLQMDTLDISDIAEIPDMSSLERFAEKHFEQGHRGDEAICEFASEQCKLVEMAYDMVQKATPEPTTENTALLTQGDFKAILPMLKQVDVPIERWSKDYHRERMDEVYEILRGRPTDKVSWEIPPLTEEQAAGVVWLIDVVLGVDRHQNDLAVCKGQDHISDTNEYHWCEKCGAVDYDDTHEDDEGETVCDLCESSDEEE